MQNDPDTNNTVKTGKRSDSMLFERALSALYGYDSKPLADDLIKRFGSVSGVLCATARELEAVPGVTHRAAALISLAPIVLRQALYRCDCPVDCERGLAVQTCIEYTERPRPFKLALFTDECGKLVHIERLDGSDEVRATISGGARNDARHFAITEYAPHINERYDMRSPELIAQIINLGKLGILFVDRVVFDGYSFRSLVRQIRNELPFDIATARTFRYVCNNTVLDRILSGN